VTFVQRGLLTILLAGLLLPGSASGGFYFPPPPDVSATWSPDSSVVVYYRFGNGLRVVDPDGSHDRLLAGLPSSPDFVFSRDWHWIGFVVYEAPAHGAVEVMRPDGSDARVVAHGAVTGSKPSFSPDGTRVAYAADDGIWTVGVDRSVLHHVTSFGSEPLWSPTGTAIAFSSRPNNHLYVVAAAGGQPVDLTEFLNLGSTGVAAWSPDGTRIAFVVGAPQGPKIAVFDVPAGSAAYFDGASGARLAWSAAGDAVYASGSGMTRGSIVRLDLATGEQTVVVPLGSDINVAPNGAVAYSSAAECGDRVGIYVRAQRITNDCHVYGTDGPDKLRSSAELYQIVDGLGGNDTLTAQGAAYVGDELDGGAGNDLLRGGYWPDKLDGGPGNDTITGGPNYDTLTGGPGRDVLRGEGGRDTIFARDGERDTLDCGTNSGTNTSKEADKAYVDRLDSVSRTCEHVYRSRR
jgi:hypothetical protein